MSLLDVSHLTKHYPTFTLKDVSFSVNAGEIVGFIGRNGAGKTTTLKSILGFIRPDEGQISFFGGEPVSPAIRQKIGFAAGGIDYYPSARLSAILDTARRFYPDWDEDACHRWLDLFGLDTSKTPSRLSAGMKVKFSLVPALSRHVGLLILDEPTSGLDPLSRDELMDIFLELRGEAGILFSTHIISDLERCADRILYIREGSIAADSAIGAFRESWRIVEADSVPEAWANRLIGIRRERNGISALVRSAEADGIPGRPASLEEIMLHLERREVGA